MGSIQQDPDGRAHGEETVTILVTGFGPFLERFPVNPSYEITKLLPNYLPASKPHRTAVRIISYPDPVSPAFDDVRELVPRLLQSYHGAIDVVLLMGMASGRKQYDLEQYARREGYTRNKDYKGKMPPLDEGRQLFSDCPLIMTSSLDFDNIISNWQRNILSISPGHPGSGAISRPSDDAGRYVCDYIYFNSLAYYGRQNGAMEGGSVTDRPVLFFHVPPESNSETLETGRAVTTALLRAIADTFTRQCEESSVTTA